jgi:neutral ceramidase
MESGFLGVVSAERQDREVTEALVSSVVVAVRRAEAVKSPARVGSASVVAPMLTVGRLRQKVDREIVVLKVVSEAGAPIALLWNYAIHGTMLPAVNLRLSGDVTGIASRELERMTGVPALFINGAVGDVSPARHGEVEAEHVGRELAAAVFSGWEAVQSTRTDRLVVGTTRVPLPAPFLSIRNCTSRWVPGWLTLPLRLALPDDAELIGGRLGDVVWVTMPGELQSWLGEAVKRAGRRGVRHAFVAGLSNDYLGYFLTEADYDRVAYVACASLYGPEAGERLTRAAEKLVWELATTRTRR